MLQRNFNFVQCTRTSLYLQDETNQSQMFFAQTTVSRGSNGSQSHKFPSRVISYSHRHQKKQTAHWPGLPAFADSSRLPTTMKHNFALYAGPVYRFPLHTVPWLNTAASLPTMANEQSISLRCLRVLYSKIMYIDWLKCMTRFTTSNTTTLWRAPCLNLRLPSFGLGSNPEQFQSILFFLI